MIDPNLYLAVVAAALTGLAMIVAAGLTGWRDWLALKRTELDQGHAIAAPSGGNAGARIEIADLKERIRKLEAIAAGVEL